MRRKMDKERLLECMKALGGYGWESWKCCEKGSCAPVVT